MKYPEGHYDPERANNCSIPQNEKHTWNDANINKI